MHNQLNQPAAGQQPVAYPHILYAGYAAAAGDTQAASFIQQLGHEHQPAMVLGPAGYGVSQHLGNLITNGNPLGPGAGFPAQQAAFMQQAIFSRVPAVPGFSDAALNALSPAVGHMLTVPQQLFLQQQLQMQHEQQHQQLQQSLEPSGHLIQAPQPRSLPQQQSQRQFPSLPQPQPQERPHQDQQPEQQDQYHMQQPVRPHPGLPQQLRQQPQPLTAVPLPQQHQPAARHQQWSQDDPPEALHQQYRQQQQHQQHLQRRLQDLSLAPSRGSHRNAAAPAAAITADDPPAAHPRARSSGPVTHTATTTGPAATKTAASTASAAPAATASSSGAPSNAPLLRALIDWRALFGASLQPYSVLRPENHGSAGATPGLQEMRLGPFEVLLAESPQAADVALEAMRSRMWDGVVAMDVECLPDTGSGEDSPIALLQLSAAGLVVLIRTVVPSSAPPPAAGGAGASAAGGAAAGPAAAYGGEAGGGTSGDAVVLPDGFRRAIVEDSDLELVVPAWGNNDERFEESFGLQAFWCTITDLQKVAKSRGHSKTGLKALVQAVLDSGAVMPKSKKSNTCNWAAPVLPPEQLKSAILNVVCTEHVFRCLEGKF